MVQGSGVNVRVTLYCNVFNILWGIYHIYARLVGQWLSRRRRSARERWHNCAYVPLFGLHSGSKPI